MLGKSVLIRINTLFPATVTGKIRYFTGFLKTDPAESGKMGGRKMKNIVHTFFRGIPQCPVFVTF